MSDNDKKSLKQVHEEHRNEQWGQYWAHRNWRSWGSWFSWGSPIGLGLFYAIVLLSTGVFIWMMHNL
jgi:hypothetical protein